MCGELIQAINPCLGQIKEEEISLMLNNTCNYFGGNKTQYSKNTSSKEYWGISCSQIAIYKFAFHKDHGKTFRNFNAEQVMNLFRFLYLFS